ncbi:hypothetical protein GCM10019016_109940 [Streptomyces prasinosporus]|uniref:Uncharacterized protein n=1 Tax=Streptomyces prasinosporus TaxID=68256 RepID=A0ABP6U8F3_9ACTN
MPSRARTSADRTALGAVVSTRVQPLSASAAAVAASTPATARNAAPGLFIFLVREGMPGLYTAYIHAMYSPFRVPSGRGAGACESRHRVARAGPCDVGPRGADVGPGEALRG